MEYQNEYANRGGMIGTSLGLGIAGTALGLLNNGGLGNILGMGCAEDHYINRFEAGKDARIAEIEAELKLRDANTYTLGEVNKLRDYMERRFDCVEHQLCDQKVYNATNTAAISAIQRQVTELQSLTKVIVPLANVCPEPMPQYNSWTAPTTTTGA